MIFYNSLTAVSHGGVTAEVNQMVQEISAYKYQIINVNRERRRILSNEVGFEVFAPISLTDVFSVLKSENYPLLWREYNKTKRIFPTTFFCEQTFSVIRRSFHVNMKQDLLTANVTNKLHERAETKWY